MAEGSVWEAFEHASHEDLSNPTAIIDVNRLGQSGETMHGWDLDSYSNRARAFGWEAIEIDGHDIAEIEGAYVAAKNGELPTAIIARTRKGKGVTAVEDKPGKHGKPLEDPEQAIAELGGLRILRVEVSRPEAETGPHKFEPTAMKRSSWEPGESAATRKGYGEGLLALGARRGDVVVLDGEVSNSTYSDAFKELYPERYFEMYIAEQQMVAAAIGMQIRGWRPFASTFAAFLTRAHDFIRMAAISRADICLCGSHAGVSIGEDGPSQMGLEDIAMLRAVHGSTVLYPSDANQAIALVEQMVDRRGIVYMRTHRGTMPVIYDAGDNFEIGGSRIVLDGDDVTLIGAGVTLHEALTAAERLSAEDISARVIDLYSVKPIDAATLTRAAQETAGILTVEDHHRAGGLGEAVLSTLAAHGASTKVRSLAVEVMPGSGRPAELLREAEIDAEAIVAAARELVRPTANV